MEIEVKNRKLLFPEVAVFDADQNASVWTFVLPESVSGRLVSELEGSLIVASDKGLSDRVFADREGTRFTVTLPSGVFVGASEAMMQFCLMAEDFAWHSEIVSAEVVRCLTPERVLETTQPSLITALRLRIVDLETRLSALEEGGDLSAAITALQTLTKAQGESLSALQTLTNSHAAAISVLQENAQRADAAYQAATLADSKITAVISGGTAAKKAECDAKGVSISEKYAKTAAIEQTYLKKTDAEKTYASQAAITALVDDAPQGYQTLKQIAQKVQAVEGAGGSGSQKGVQLDFIVDLASYVWDGALDYPALNTALSNVKSEIPAGLRGNVYFVKSKDCTGFLSSAEHIVWQSDMNYHFLAEETYSVAKLVLNGVQNVAFYDASIKAVCEGHILQLSGCTNVAFYNCNFVNEMGLCASIENCTGVIFQDCNLAIGTYQAFQVFTITDNGSERRWIRVEDCFVENQNFMVASLSGVRNDKFYLRMNNVRLPDNSPVSVSNIGTSSHGTLSFAAEN